ncbi:MAG: hypothetical protein IJS08_15785 [Victivallales bacterium]|nr:hypothetical protein [Victivallales bacterium]
MSLYIFRGLPGAGKSKRARELADQLHCMLIEPDALLYKDGKYRYSYTDYEDAVDVCLRILFDIKMSGLSFPDIVFADVLWCKDDIKELEELYGEPAKKITTLEIDLETALRRNIHHVSEHDLRFMAEHFQRIEGPNAVIEDAMDELIYDKELPEGW